jgi:hypothetical protein
MCKSHKYFRHLCCLTFRFMNILFRAYFQQKNFKKKVCQKFLRLGSGSRSRTRSESEHFQKSDPDPFKNHPDL